MKICPFIISDKANSKNGIKNIFCLKIKCMAWCKNSCKLLDNNKKG